ncbi:uncharacterized protein BO88DRAFT_440608 [Aspergillus vadensis CBS 113365]|uniref:Altered inheritance of mitochondria protein 9, mitochondrial n=1 Tax=Aspergillus vadensis (strain CBS 113365 / IMI 142717 / IBT 24658) TaxID=1448311 RepID=A0A319BLT8_ASPVC|nr:hypothetical protein BO88DRAFT_440608 [Aspergillus vadensis CBS 113365]PYH73311.1 hypothetical protein BO88DRAFT_440608 [Aspergillus vadensis CBS 113365]
MYHTPMSHDHSTPTDRGRDDRDGVHLDLDPHHYTSGRWLRKDDEERASRYIQFDFDALCRKVLTLSPGARIITRCQKLEGGFNRVFIFELDNDKRVVARLPFSLAGPAQLTTSSEIATIEYLQGNTTVPIPKILAWSNDATSIDNPIGSKYIIMEHATGVQLHKKWHEMGDKKRIKCIDAIYRKLKEVVDLQFPCFGSLHSIRSPVSPDNRRVLDGDFCIGPHCGTRYWDCGVGSSQASHYTKPNRGPWNDLYEYCDGLIDAGLSRLPAVDFSDARPDEMHVSGSPDKGLCDTSIRNIFVSEGDPSELTAIIDWQAASVEPAFWYADEIPDFATENEVCTRAFDVCTQFLIPTLSKPRLINQNLFRPFRYSYRTWKDGAAALHHDLIDTSQNWEQLGFARPCPYVVPPPHKLADHQKKYRLFEAAHNLRYDLAGLLNTATDGWVPTGDWEAAQTAHHEMFDGMLQAVLTNPEIDDPDEPVKDEETLRSIWPFDIWGLP